MQIPTAGSLLCFQTVLLFYVGSSHQLWKMYFSWLKSDKGYCAWIHKGLRGARKGRISLDGRLPGKCSVRPETDKIKFIWGKTWGQSFEEYSRKCKPEILCSAKKPYAILVLSLPCFRETSHNTPTRVPLCARFSLREEAFSLGN